MRAGDDLHADDLADLGRGGSTGVRGGFHAGDIALEEGGDVAGADFFPAGEGDVRGLERGGDLPLWQPWNESFLVFDSAEGGGVRMSSETITATALVQRVLGDARFADAGERCAFLGRLAGWRPLPPEGSGAGVIL